MKIERFEELLNYAKYRSGYSSEVFVTALKLMTETEKIMLVKKLHEKYIFDYNDFLNHLTKYINALS